MRYFNGFSLYGEEKFFSDYLLKSEQCISGFSYGAQRAFEYVYNTEERIDRLILLSPAFFQTENSGFIRTQLRYFEAGKEAYVRQFLKNIAYPSAVEADIFLQTGSKTELEALLCYQWDVEKLEEVLKKGTVIEVFLGQEDKIIDSKAAYKFFEKLVPTYWIKGAGHLLLSKGS